MKPSHMIILSAALFADCNGQTKPESSNIVQKVVDSSNAGPAYLPKPHATKSSVNLCRVIGWDGGTTPKAPEGFKVTAYGKDYKHPRWTYQLPNGDVIVAETKQEPKGTMKMLEAISSRVKSQGVSTGGNRLVILRDSNKDGNPDMQSIFLDSLFMPFGMVLLNNYFYVACTDAVLRYPYKEGQTLITSAPEKILELPEGARHWTKNIVANKKGTKLYIAVGSASNHGENGMDTEERRACIIEINPDGSGERIYASGLRNPVGMDWMPGTDELWTVVNERDELGDDLVPDFLTNVKSDGFYGWPYSYFGSNLDPRIDKDKQRMDLVRKTIVPDVDLGSHTASLGLGFYRGKVFPGTYQNGAFIGQHGSWNRSVPSGYKVVFVPFKDGKAGAPVDFLTGFMMDEKKNEVHGRPVGVTMLKDGSMLVADDSGNSVWRVSYGK